MFNLVNRAKKKNNKGFSLVELIVVVLIIAIIAVALAPQVMKYVSSSRTNVDQNNAASIKSSIQAATAEFIGAGGTITGKDDVAVASKGTLSTTDFGTGTVNSETGTNKTLVDIINANVGANFPEIKSNNAASWYISIDAAGAVKVTAGVAEDKDSVAAA